MPLPEWLSERGIGETRAALVEDGEIVEARIELDGIVAAGTVVATKLVDVGRSGRNAVAADSSGTEYLLREAPAGVTQGVALNVEILREAIPGAEPWKRPLARPTDQAPRAAARLSGREVAFPSPGGNELDAAG